MKHLPIPPLSSIKAFLFDVDNTLTNTKREITPRTIAAVKLLQDHGKMTVICSGRHAAMLKHEVFPFFAPNDVHITAGGSHLVNTLGETLWERKIPTAVAQEIIRRADDLKMGVNCPQNNELRTNQYFRERYSHLTRFSGSEQLDAEQIDGAHIVVVTEATSEFTRFLDTIPEISYKFMPSSIGTMYADINSVGVNKATGIMQWCRITGIQPEEIMGFGDAENDVEFLQFVGHSVAMGNAQPTLKEQVNHVIGHTDQDGLAKFIEQLVKGAL